MIWKLYKIVTALFIRNVVSALIYGNHSNEVIQLQDKINRLRHIIVVVRQYTGLHPAFARERFGTLRDYLQQRLSLTELTLLADHMSLLPTGVNAQIGHSLT